MLSLAISLRYAVCSSILSDSMSNKSPFGTRLMWTCPSKPAQVLNVEEKEGVLRWNGVSDEDEFVLYELRYGLDSWIDRKWYYIRNINETSKRLVNLTPRTTYVVEIRAISPGGFGEWSDRIKFLTKDCARRGDDDDDSSSSSDDEDESSSVTVIEYTEA